MSLLSREDQKFC